MFAWSIQEPGIGVMLLAYLIGIVVVVAVLRFVFKNGEGE